jgi:hypothetical protein
MNVSIQLMSGDVHSLYIPEGDNIYWATTRFFDTSSDLVSIRKRLDDGEFVKVLPYDVIEEGDHFYVFLKQAPPPPVTVYMDFTGHSLVLTAETGEVIMDFDHPEDVSRVPERITLITRIMEQDCCDYMAARLGYQHEHRLQTVDDYCQVFVLPYIGSRIAVTMFH